MGRSAIEWTDDTWNPVRGCSRVSEGCRHCYAEQQAARIVRMGKGKPTPYDGIVRTVGGEARWTGEIAIDARRLAAPLSWREPRNVFVDSMSDLFYSRRPNEHIAAVFGVMAATRHITYQILTKYASRLREWFEWVATEAAKSGPGAEVELCVNCADEEGAIGERIVVAPPWPLPNVWLGVSVENQAAADERIPELLATLAAVRFLSCEPLLGDVRLTMLDEDKRGRWFDYLTGPNHIDWVIAGCESGSGARPADSTWYRSLRDQCAAAGVPFFLKQATEEGTWAGDNEHEQTVLCGEGSHRKPGGIIGAPYLDGRQHLEFPVVR